MIVSKILSNYIKIPNKIMNCIGPFYNMLPPNIRYGKTFYETRETLEFYETLSRDEIENLQNELFINMVTHAYEHVPYYHKLFLDYGISIKQIQNVTDCNRIPFLTKEILKEKKDELIADNVSKSKLHWITTSGTTGAAIGFYLDDNAAMKDWAWNTYLYKRAGWEDNCSKLMLRGKLFYNKMHGKSWQYDSFKRELSVDVFQMDDIHTEEYCKAIEKYKPDNIFGYMSSILLLCKYIEKRGGISHQFSGVYACSEMVLQEQREYVEKILNTRVFSNYGMSEKVILASECEYSHEYHVEPLYGLTEIVNQDGRAAQNGEVGELVGTGFNSMGMPLIRYKTGDMASWSTQEKCKCGRIHRRISRIEGRWKNDYLIGKDGTKIYLAAINMHSDVFDELVRYQFVQEEMGRVIFKANFAENLCNAVQQEKIKKELQEKFRGNMAIDVMFTDQMKLEASGKYKIIHQNVGK